MAPRLARQYFIQTRGKEPIDIDKLATECIKSFTARYGYKPSLMTANQELLNRLHVRKDIDVMAEKVQRNHIRLYEVVLQRQPRVLSTARKPKKE